MPAIKGIARSLGGSTGPSGRKGRARTGSLFYIALDDTKGKKHLRNLQGKFIALEASLDGLHARLASDLVARMVSNLQESLLRPGVSTSRLADALEHRDNRVSDRFGFGAGNIPFLDRSQAKYWRAIELGSTAHLGHKLTGVWGATLTGSDTGGGKYGPYPLAGPEYSPFSGRRSDRLIPMSRKRAYNLLRASGYARRGRGSANSTKGIISVPIRAHLYMRKAYQWSRTSYAAEVQKAFANAGLPVPKKGKARAGKPRVR